MMMIACLGDLRQMEHVQRSRQSISGRVGTPNLNIYALMCFCRAFAVDLRLLACMQDMIGRFRFSW